MRKFLAVASGILLLSAAAFLLGWTLSRHRDFMHAEQAAPSSPRPSPAAAAAIAPNVVWVVLDACRSDHLSCYGYGHKTSPVIDEIAKGGVLFENNYAQGLMTTLSVPAYMTGQFLPTYCLYHPEGRGVPRVAPADEKLAPEIFRENGYTTLCFSGHPGISPQSPLMKAFDKGVFVPSPDRFPSCMLSHMLPQIKTALAADTRPDKPFFLYIHAMDTHFPHRGRGKWSADTYVSDDIRNGMPLGQLGCSFDAEEKECMCNLHDSSIEGADHALGLLKSMLEERGLAESTLFVVASDHGELLGEDGVHWGHELFIADPVLRTPLIMAGPGLPRGMRVPGITRSIDVLPTLLELTGAHTSACMQGVSLMPVVRGEKPETGEPVFSRAGTYEDNLVFILVNHEHRYEYTLDTGAGRVFAARDAELKELAGVPGETTARYRGEITERLLPFWQKYLTNPPMFRHFNFKKQFDTAWVSPADAMVAHADGAVDPADLTDNRWTFSDGMLWAANSSEKAPPITLTFKLDPGKYDVLVVLADPKQATAHPGSSMTVQLQGGTSVDATWIPQPRDHLIDNYVRVGDADLADGVCRLTITPDVSERWSALCGVKFLRTDGGTVQDTAGASPEELKEKLKALGYLN